MSNKIISILGPTNTGKTYLAIERMLDFNNGVIGFPLRLLAREVYDKVCLKAGKSRVALITGEEKIIPNNANYYLCTVESMPTDINFEFAAIDEIQMCADPERGHIFTNRLLHYRGDKLTMFLGSDTMKNKISELIPSCEFIYRERLSKLTFSGYKKISRINPRSALIAFSTDEVYSLAEFVRRQKGGAAIVMGSLSPKTRNSQVEMYQSGDVDYLIATDAIGMGINMNINSVYFNSLKKFDGKNLRKLRNSEIGQIAGRAGRHINDGNFGTTGDCEPLSEEQIEKLENHKFDEIINIFWRNHDLDFSSSENLIRSLNKKPDSEYLIKNKDLLDENIFRSLVSEKKILKFQDNTLQNQLLWECCQIPDFTKSSYNEHRDIIVKVFNFLISDKGTIPNLWMKQQISALENYEGNIDALANRISHVRTWSYVSNKRNWVENSSFWTHITKSIEDKLSDKLHEELSKNFVDKRISILSKSLSQDIERKTKISENNEVYVDDQYVGNIKGLKIEFDYSSKLQTDLKSIRKAARNASQSELVSKISEILNNLDQIQLREDLGLYFENQKIAEIQKGKNYLHPEIKLFCDDTVENKYQEKLHLNLKQYIQKKINHELQDLISIENPKSENSYIRGICYQLFENHGVIKRETIKNLIQKLNPEEKKELRKKGIKIGRYHLYQPRMIRPNALKLKTTLLKNFFSHTEIAQPNFGINFAKNFSGSKEILLICGFETFHNMIVRVDILERLFLQIMQKMQNDKFKIDSSMLNLLGCSKEDMEKLLVQLQYKQIKNKDNDEVEFIYLPKKNIKKGIAKKINSSFSILKRLQNNQKNNLDLKLK